MNLIQRFTIKKFKMCEIIINVDARSCLSGSVSLFTTITYYKLTPSRAVICKIACML
jgi:hypothetical protein